MNAEGADIEEFFNLLVNSIPSLDSVFNDEYIRALDDDLCDYFLDT